MTIERTVNTVPVFLIVQKIAMVVISVTVVIFTKVGDILDIFAHVISSVGIVHAS